MVGALQGFQPPAVSRRNVNVWKVLPGAVHFLRYACQSESFEAKERLNVGLEPVVEVWENTSGIGGFDRGTEAVPISTKVRFIHVDRTAMSGGPVIYSESSVLFVVDDPTY